MKTILEQDGIVYESDCVSLLDPCKSWKSIESGVKYHDLRLIDKKIHCVSMILDERKKMFKPQRQIVYWREYKSPESYRVEHLQDQIKILREEYVDFTARVQHILADVALKMNKVNNEHS